ncbi:MAG: thioredoxin domain-containing protein [Bellilinea sp.]
MPNHLANEISPYLLQHVNNPVDWYPWGPEALSRAKAEGKPIFLSIGYAACHWCHVMAHESFEDQVTADLLNQHFISIKVDREERPDLDSIYMAAVVTMTQQGGWPMSVFLTPDLKPFYGGTYFPPEPRHNLPAFREVLRSIQAAWQQERDQVVHVSEQILANIQNNSQLEFTQQNTIHPKILSEALNGLLSQYDWAYGGWGRAPKFPQPMLIELLLTHAAHGNQEALDAARHALDAMSRGGMYDVIGGGFHRYSTDSGWLVPHFEKMLYDNAQLAHAYLHAALQTGNPYYRIVTEETLDFMLREMRHPLGGFFTSIDADSEGGEGAFYTWLPAEITASLTDPDDLRLFTESYGMPAVGNFDGRLIFQRLKQPEKTAAALGMDETAYLLQLKNVHTKLRLTRDTRSRPETDTKIILAWNAMAISSFAEAGRYFDRSDYLRAAQQGARFILSAMTGTKTLFRSWRDGYTTIPAFLEDYAAFILALLTLYQADGDGTWYQAAVRLTDEMLEKFQDPSGGFFDASTLAGALLYRPKDLQDNATPSGNSLATRSLLLLAALSGEELYQQTAENSLKAIQETLAQYPTAFGSWLQALDLVLNPYRQVAIVWDSEAPAAKISALTTVVEKTYRPRCVYARSPLPIASDQPELLQNRPAVNNSPTAYVCQDFVCQLPVTDPEALHRQLG